jgi:hypothetical protein
MNHTEVENPQEAEIDENTCRKDFTGSEIYEICEFYYEKLSRQKEGLKQYADNTVVVNHNDGEQPIDVVAKVVHKSTQTVSRINQIFKSDCIDIQEKAASFLCLRLSVEG